MNHGQSNRKFGRETKQRGALMMSLAVSLISHNRIVTTQAKAKSLRPYVEKLVSSAKTSSVATTKLLASRLPSKTAQKLMKEIAPRFADRNGGYTRILNLPQRPSDGARMAIIEFIA